MKEYQVFVNFDGIVIVSAESAEDAERQIAEMSMGEIIEHATGSLDIGDIEAIEE